MRNRQVLVTLALGTDKKIHTWLNAAFLVALGPGALSQGTCCLGTVRPCKSIPSSSLNPRRLYSHHLEFSFGVSDGMNAHSYVQAEVRDVVLQWSQLTSRWAFLQHCHLGLVQTGEAIWPPSQMTAVGLWKASTVGDYPKNGPHDPLWGLTNART